MSGYKNEAKYMEAFKEYQQNKNMTLTYLADKYSFDRASFSRYLKSKGIEIKRTNVNKETADKYDEGLKLYKEGYSINQIYNILKINKKNFSLYLKKQDIEVRNGFEKSGYTVNENYFSIIDSADKAYWLGFIYADGCVRNQGNIYRLAIELNNIDKSHLYKLKEYINSNVEVKDRKSRPTCSVTIDKKKIVDDLYKYGCIQNKTVNGYIDLELIKGFEKDFLRGYLDGDGFIEKNYKKYRITYTVKSETITNSLMELLKDFNPRFEDCNTYNRIHIEQKDNFFKLLNYLYEDAEIYLDRKYYTYLDRKHAHLSQTL